MADEKTSAEFSFVAAEHNILEFWKEADIFQKSLAATKDRQPFIFYDGPPFATGLPHHGHLLASTIKDIVPRYWTMKGRHVIRRFGWDCHGLPIEHEIDKQMGLSAQEAVEKLGVAGYNNACRGIVQRFVDQWRFTITRLGRWVDFDDDYKTMDVWYMESLWWVVKELWNRELIYQGEKVMPISTAFGTPLSNFEANLNYKDVQDPAVTVLFKLTDENAFMAAWTTTPWTLISNLGLCVGDDIDYVKVKDGDKNIYLAQDRLADFGDLEILTRVKGSELVGKHYQPLFPYFAAERERGAFVVSSADYVTTESGTGIVHQAPAFGEDDYQTFKDNGIDAFACPVDLEGKFAANITEFAGQYVKDADKEIIVALKQSDALYRQDVIQHSYPYCYRSDTPLIYRTIPSWYVAVTKIGDKLIAANEKVRWVPDHIKEGRFGNWLKGAVDWAISRNRVWGTPLPIWINDETGAAICIGSREELCERTGVMVTDLHREFVDDLTFEVAGEKGTYRRIEEVLDCWFESGSMPYAQLHYPFENEKVFKAGFPAEFIAEGLDQTRGWFYTLTVLSAALYDKPAFRNVIVNGMVMAEDGKKMSKSRQNFTAPDELMESYGADALRLYLINSGLVRGEEQRFADSGLKDMTRRALLPWYHAFSFLKTYAEIDEWAPEKGLHFGSNILDQWILAKLQTLKTRVADELEAYRLYNVVPPLFEFIENLTNWYIRLNRVRFWGEDVSADKIAAYSTLYRTLQELNLVMAPFAPFLSEHLYQQLARMSGTAPKPESVHLCEFPVAEAALIKPELEITVDRMQQVILLGRRKREEVKIGLRTPLRTVTIIHADKDLLNELTALENYIKSELNVQQVAYSSDETAYIERVAKPNFPVLGKRLGARMKEFQGAIRSLDATALELLQSQGSLTLNGETFTLDEIDVFQAAKAGTNVVTNRFISIDLDCTLDTELVHGGYAREIVHHIQRGRKDQGFKVSDRIGLAYDGDEELLKVMHEHGAYIASEILALEIEQATATSESTELLIDGKNFRFKLTVIKKS